MGKPKHVAKRNRSNNSRWYGVGKYAWDNRRTIAAGGKRFYNKITGGPSVSSAPSHHGRQRTVKKRGIMKPVSQIHSGVDKSSATVTLHKRLKLGKTQKQAGIWHYVQNHVLKTLSQTGSQNANVLAAGCTLSQLLVTSGSTYTPYQSAVSYESLNPNLTNTGGSLVPVVVTPLNDRFIVENQLVAIDITNMGGTLAYCELYLVTAKTANTSDPITDWNNGYFDDGFGMSQYISPAAGLTGTGVTGRGYQGYVGSTPAETSTFRAQWKVRHRHKFELSGGAAYQHSIMVNVNSIIKRDNVNRTAGSYKVGTSWVLFLVQRGAVLIDVTGGAAIPTYGTTELATIVTVKSRMSAVAGQASRLPIVVMNNEVPFNANAVNEHLINEVDGAVAANTLLTF